MNLLLKSSPKARLIRSAILSRFDFFAMVILGLKLKPFHLEWIDYQLNHTRTLFLGPRGSWKCVSGDTYVPTYDGLKQIVDLNVGDNLVSPFGGENRVLFKAGFRDSLYRVTFSDGTYLDCTYDEKLAVLQGSGFDFVPLINVQLGQRVLSHVGQAVHQKFHFKRDKSNFLSTSGFAELLAWGLVNGHEVKPHQFHVKDSLYSIYPRLSRLGCGSLNYNKFLEEFFFNEIPRNFTCFGLLGLSCFLRATKFLLRRRKKLSFLRRQRINQVVTQIVRYLGFVSPFSLLSFNLQAKKERDFFCALLDGQVTTLEDCRIDQEAFRLEIDWVDVAERLCSFFRRNPNVPLALKIQEGFRFYRNWSAELEEFYLDWEQECIREEARQFVDEFLEFAPREWGFQFEVKKVEYPLGVKKVRSIVKVASDVPVFDIQTEQGVYVANSTVVHNSTILDVGFSLWSALRDPEIRIAIVSKTSTKSAGFVGKIKALCERNKLIRTLFVDRVHPPSAEKWTQSALTFSRVGTYPEPTISALGIGSSLGGSHFNYIIFDDLVDIDHTHSRTQREKVWNWFRHVALPTLDILSDETRAHLIGTRYHKADLYGRLIKLIDREKRTNWTVFRQPALLDNGISFWPEKFSVAFLESVKRDFGDDVFFLQYQNDDSFLSGGFASEEDFVELRVIPDDKKITRLSKIMGVDLATASTKRNPKKSSFAVVILAFDRENKTVLVDKIYKKKVVRLPDQRELINHFFKEFSPELIVFEGNAYQQVFLDYLDEGGPENEMLLPIKMIYSTTPKEVNHESLMSLVTRKKILFRETATNELISELCNFPDTTFDLGDACSFALRAFSSEPRVTLL